MIGTIIWLIGVFCAIWCVMDIFKKNISTAGKVIASIVVLLTSWLGFAVYYFYAKTTCRSGSGKKLKGFEMREVRPGNLPRFFDIGN